MVKSSMRVAMALGIGYLLGRQHKLRTATMMAVAAAAGGTSVGGIAMRRGAKLLASSGVMDKMPAQVGEIVETVRSDLVDAGKAAASATVTSKIDSLAGSLHDRAERFRNPGEAVAEGTEAAGDTAGRAEGAARGAASGATRRLRGRGARDERTQGEREDQEREDDVTDEESYPEDEYDEDDTEARDEAEEAEEKPVPRQRTGGRRRPAVTRTRR